ncbi:ORC-CDC6 family AAA ATPase [Dechloromonas agitata]|uniref:ORC-CDC6 family AAA ATPase n=1 Tax=Dechloromonas agitata TaxID=73030 RepID=UPI0004B37C53|nr:hypothetical protein [Dechloromonas agitata]
MLPIVDHTILSKTRAEEHDADVWGKFFIPPYFTRLALKTATKSTYIVGKRGCGKTMLLKYLDYHTAFSNRRTDIDRDEIQHIGIYWRVDTQFCNSLHHRGLSEADWISIFENYFALVISVELIRSIRAVALSSYPDFSEDNFNSLRFPSVKDFHPDFPVSPNDLERYLEGRRRAFSTWISNMASMERPLLPPGKFFLDSLISDIKESTGLEGASFYIYVDEVENLVPYQRRVLNSFLKHSQRPLIISFTSKELSGESRTTGPESINATHDFRLLVLDELMDETERQIFFAEVFLANLDLAEANQASELLRTVRTLDCLAGRQSNEYRKRILDEIRAKFPTLGDKEFAQEAVGKDRILNILKERIKKALDDANSSISPDAFLKYSHIGEALIVVPALLNRQRLQPEQVLAELALYDSARTGKFSTSWIHNNLVGSLLEAYRPYRQECPIYSGFDTFCTMANNNLRHFLILCYKALEISELKDEEADVFPVSTQARAAYEAADQLIREIKTFGEFGERLRMFVLRLGSLFRALQAKPAMSEPEQNQFTINSGNRPLDESELLFIGEAKKYAILIEQLETKAKGEIGDDIIDYQLNPIYAPYFWISYRRKRKISLSVEDFHVLAVGTENEYRELAGKLVKTDGRSSSGLQLDLML